ncbi:ABC transporter substrate-binding protein [Sporomusa termitida]|uniref:Putative ABC transporter PGF-CTERM-modified substrate-binding protein n=1 Tax=Sporomusa termitida TaxID=2377 RepID=A0A517DNX7_9FIRM|nr:ABC transporter substrate-binding protein [Sporomusa termitida]QDR79070.1 putative ABC transporter PGF-CTERM-modified substrate-binding protein [Sporomusa termitida]
MRYFQIIKPIVFLLCLLLLCAGCANQQRPQAEPSAAGYEVRDGQGNVLKLRGKPQRIISLSVSTDEILLGLVPSGRIAALTYLADDGGLSNITEQAKAVPARIRANPEVVIALQPDLVIVPDWQPLEFVQTVRDAGFPVYIYQWPNSIEEIKNVILEIARAVGEPEAGAKLVADMDNTLAEVVDRVRPIPDSQRPVVVRFSLMGGSDGKGTTFDDICQYAGVKNGAALAGLGMNDILSKEQLVKVNPDILLMPTWDYTGKTDMAQFAADIQNDPALQSVKAIRRQQLVSIPERYLVCTSQYIVWGVKNLASYAYPQYFPEK